MFHEERELPLFPLGAVVLFPGMPLPLRVFEERYKQMLADIQQADSCFGVVLIKEGHEVGEPAVPCPVGTVARVTELRPARGDQFYLTCTGERCFRVLETLRERPYIVARVALLDREEGSPTPSELVQGVRQAFQEYMRLMVGLRGGWTQGVEAPTEPARLSYLVGGLLEVAPPVKQGLLEAENPAHRLQLELALLHQATARLKERLQKEGPKSRFSQN